MEDGGEITDENLDLEEDEEGEFEEGVKSSARRESPKKKPCNQRIHELSIPNKRMFLALWNEHAYHLPKDKVKHLKQLLQQLFALSPEETMQYFAELRAEAKAAAMRRKLKQKLRKFLVERHQQKQRQRAYRLFKKLLKCGISYAARNPVPPLVSVRLRYLSDVILEQLCFLRRLDIPDRANPDKQGFFLISVADWMAIAVERLYYAAQLSVNELTEQAQAHDQSMEVPTTYEGFDTPIASSTPRTFMLDETMKVPKRYDDLGHPIASSTPRKQKDETMKVPKRYDDLGHPIASSTPRTFTLDETMKVPKRYDDLDHPIASSTPRKQKDETMKVPKGYEDLSQPIASSTVRRPPFGETMKVPQTYAQMGQPGGSSTPKRLSLNTETMAVPNTYAGVGQPIMASTPKSSLSSHRDSDRLSLNPFYTFIPPESAIKRKKSQTKMSHPSYNYTHNRPPPESLQNTYLEIPPYGFERMPKSASQQKRQDR